MLRYIKYRKYEFMGLVLFSLGIYAGYKVYSITGVATNPLTNKKKLICMNEET